MFLINNKTLLFLKKDNPAEELSRLVQCLISKHGDLSSDSQAPMKSGLRGPCLQREQEEGTAWQEDSWSLLARESSPIGNPPFPLETLSQNVR